MSIINKYIDFTINNDNTFYIVESSSKPKTYDSAMATLAKLEFIVKNKLIYDSSHHDTYSSQSQCELFDLLKAKSSQIHKGYQEKQSKLIWIIRKIFSKEKQISAIHQRILNYIKPAQVLPLPNELIQEITKYLGFPELKAFAQLNHHGKDHAETVIVKQAKKFGYEGKDHVKAFKYMDNLLEEVSKLTEQKIIPKNCLSYVLKKHFFYKEKKIDPERILQNLNALSATEIFSLFTNPKIVNHPTFYTFLLGIVRKYLNTTPKKLIEINLDSALMVAVKAGNKEAVQLLLDHGANHTVNNHSAVLQYAYFHGQNDICQLLLDHGAAFNFNNKEGNTALLNATIFGHEKTVQFLLQHGGNPNLINYLNESILMIAASRNNEKIVELLLDYGADHNYLTRSGTSALMEAVNRTDNKKIVQLLLDRGANPNHRDNEGNTALIKAVEAVVNKYYYRPADKEVVRLLLDRGANPNLINDEGTSALLLALDANNKEVVRLLSDYGAFGYVRR